MEIRNRPVKQSACESSHNTVKVFPMGNFILVRLGFLVIVLLYSTGSSAQLPLTYRKPNGNSRPTNLNFSYGSERAGNIDLKPVLTKLPDKHLSEDEFADYLMSVRYFHPAAKEHADLPSLFPDGVSINNVHFHSASITKIGSSSIPLTISSVLIRSGQSLDSDELKKLVTGMGIPCNSAKCDHCAQACNDKCCRCDKIIID